jgi:E1A/CREB-binding protein
MVNSATTTSISTSTIVKMEVDDSSNAGDNNTINTNIEIKSEKVSADDIKTEQIEIKQEIIQISIAEKMLQKLKDDTEDVDDTQDCEHFETRQALLNLCQGNHYQFDQLRRAKHTSLMILYHLHNPDAPKFIITCATCTSDILSGYRHHCETCDSDICSKCYKGNKCTRCNTTLRPLVVSGGQPAVQLTEEQRIERNKNIQLHLTLLLHATSCRECQSKNCFKMKVNMQLYYI